MQGGVLRRPGHTEASVDLCRLAGCRPAGVLCEIVNDDGSMARTPELLAFAQQHGLKVITIADLVRYRLKHDRLVEATAVATQQTRWAAGWPTWAGREAAWGGASVWRGFCYHGAA